jgi:adenylate cyclase
MDWEAEGHLDGVEGEAARAARRALLDDLHAGGVPVEELRAAAAEDRLVLLPVERVLTAPARHTAREIARASDVDLDFFQASRRALGLAVPGPDERVYGEEDLRLARAGARLKAAGFPDGEALEVTRILGQGLARYAEATRTMAGRALLEAGIDEHELARRYEAVARELLPLAGPWMEQVFRLHLRQALRDDAVTREQLASGRMEDTQETAVAFADLVGFTSLGESAPLEELSGVAGRLGELAGELAAPPVRFVKQIGDAVMLVAPDVEPLLGAVVGLVERTGGDDDLPALRAGVAFGEAVNRWGDWYGAPVNLASRLTARARPDSVLASAEVRERAGEAWSFSSAGSKRLKGLSAPVRAYRVRRAGDGDGGGPAGAGGVTRSAGG